MTAYERTTAAGARPLLFLDMEGSSREDRSWPVAIAYAWYGPHGLDARRWVIAPRPDWPLHAWSEAAAEVHGLSLRDVQRGRPAETVADETDAFAGFEVVSPDPRWHQLWLDRLRAGRPRIEVADVAAVTRRCGLACAWRRAPEEGPDAVALARAWRGALPAPAPLARIA